MTGRRPWTEAEDNAVLVLTADGPVTSVRVRECARKLDRSYRAVRERAKHLGRDGIARVLTIAALSRTSGYSESRIHTAVERLRIKLIARGRRRNGTVYSYEIPKQHVTNILRECASRPDGGLLTASKHGEWGRRGKYRTNPIACLECGTFERPHYALGYCTRCYTRIRKQRKKEPLQLLW